MIRARVHGLDRLKRKVRRMNPVVKTAVRESLVIWAGEFVDMAQRLAPFLDGDLEQSISWEFTTSSSGAETRGSIKGDEGLSVTVSAGGRDAFHAPFQEFGTVESPAQPFFFPTHRALRRRGRARMSRNISKAIKRTTGA